MLRHRYLFVSTLIVLLIAPPALAQNREQAELREIIERLEMGMTALDALGRNDLYERLNEVARELRGHVQKDEGRQYETLTQPQAEGRLELLRLAFEIVRETDHGHEADRLEHAVHVYELALSEGDSEEFRAVREDAPRRPEQVELIGFAAHIAEGRGERERMRRLLLGRDELWPGWQEGIEREQPRDAGVDRERRLGRERLEMLHTALPALREAEQMDAVELVERAIRATEMNLEGRDGPQAREIRRTAPPLRQQSELLMMASEIWEELGHETKAVRLRAYATDMRDADRVREMEMERDRPRARDRAREMEMERDRPRARELDRDRAREMEMDRDRPHDRDRAREMEMERDRPRGRDRGPDGPARADVESVSRRLDALEERLSAIERLLQDVVRQR